MSDGWSFDAEINTTAPSVFCRGVIDPPAPAPKSSPHDLHLSVDELSLRTRDRTFPVRLSHPWLPFSHSPPRRLPAWSWPLAINLRSCISGRSMRRQSSARSERSPLEDHCTPLSSEAFSLVEHCARNRRNPMMQPFPYNLFTVTRYPETTRCCRVPTEPVAGSSALRGQTPQRGSRGCGSRTVAA